MSEKEPKPLPAIYCRLFVRFTHIARAHGYALAMHGSMQRDGDFLAVAWSEDSSTRKELVEAFIEEMQLLDLWGRYGVDKATLWDQIIKTADKPHGRRAYTLLIPAHAGTTIFVDLSVLGPDEAV